jgi:hypothetical protein
LLEYLEFVTALWYILWPFGTFYGHLVILWQLGIFFPRFGLLCQEKSGNPDQRVCAYVCPLHTLAT